MYQSTSQKQSQQKVTIKVNMLGFQEQQLTFGQETETDMLLDYDQICKKVLQTFKYISSGKHNIRLVLTNFYNRTNTPQIPIYNPKNWTTLIADMLERGIYSINVQVTQLGTLREKKKRLKEAPVQFDTDGEIQSAQDNNVKEAIIKNTPSAQAYKGTDVVRCHFCQKTSRESQGSRSSGAFYGPFKNNVYAHLMCLLWCSDVYLDDNLKFIGVGKAISFGKVKQCIYCKQKGASFYCHEPSCKKSAHYICATKHNWFFNWNKFTVYCPNQVLELQAIINNQNPSQTKTITSKIVQRKEVKMQIQRKPEKQISVKLQHNEQK